MTQNPTLLPNRTGVHICVDLAAAKANWQKLNHMSGAAQTGATVKANAYGLGIEQIAPILKQAGCNSFFAALPQEALKLRGVLGPSANIYALNGCLNDRECAHEFVANNIIPVISSFEQLRFFSEVQSKASFALQVDTGMNRLGVSFQDCEQIAQSESILANMSLLMSHLACADDPTHDLNALQLERFTQITKLFPNKPHSLANSAAHFLGKDYMFDLTRPGISIYGGNAQYSGSAKRDAKSEMLSVARVSSKILQIRSAKKGEAVGYGAAYTLQRDSDIAICSIGYADGYLRSSGTSDVQNRETKTPGPMVFYGGQKIPIIGRVSMDLIAVDVSDIPHQKREEDCIELFGKNIALDDVAAASGTIGYELLTGLSNRASFSYI